MFMFTEKDIQQIKSKGLSVEDINHQIQNLIHGFPYISLEKPATINDGIIKLSEAEVSSFVKLFDDIKPDALKFVPASGAASRMFKFLFEFYESAKDKYNSFNEITQNDVKVFFQSIRDFAFFDDLKNIIQSKGGNIDEYLKQGWYKKILGYFLFENGLNYGQKPKAVLAFHKYETQVRTALEEHLAEGALYAKSGEDIVKIHFTISPEHEELFKNILKKELASYESLYKVKYDITFSVQKPSTDMVSVDLENNLFRNDDGTLLFRPGGHGALIENLNDLDADIIFIKNIDNVVPDKLKEQTIIYKKALAGVLLSYRERIYNYLELLESKKVSNEQKEEIHGFITHDLCYNIGKLKDTQSLYAVLNRPIRVCGMVKNEGEPGGGPFWVKHPHGVIDLQVVESSQIDTNYKEQTDILKASTHFNPVDLVCSTKDYKGNKFELLNFRDPQTGFISIKSKDGQELKAQELPGLWNGAMAFWNTIFVEVPIITFNPVKTINDLLRKEHQ